MRSRRVALLLLALAFLGVGVWAAVLPASFFAAPHWLYHAVNLEPLVAADAGAQTALLTLQVAAAVWLLGWPAPCRVTDQAPVGPPRAEREAR